MSRGMMFHLLTKSRRGRLTLPHTSGNLPSYPPEGNGVSPGDLRSLPCFTIHPLPRRGGGFFSSYICHTVVKPLSGEGEGTRVLAEIVRGVEGPEAPSRACGGASPPLTPSGFGGACRRG